MIEKIVALLLLFSAYAACSSWEVCKKRISDSYDIYVNITECENRDRCPLYTGEVHTISIYFRPNVSTNNSIERVIMARLNLLTSGKPLEINYGVPINASSKIIRVSDGKSMGEVGLERGVLYKYEDNFPVPSAITTQLTVRFILRDFLPGRQRWDQHRGYMYSCVEVKVVVTGRETLKGEQPKQS